LDPVFECGVFIWFLLVYFLIWILLSLCGRRWKWF